MHTYIWDLQRSHKPLATLNIMHILVSSSSVHILVAKQHAQAHIYVCICIWQPSHKPLATPNIMAGGAPLYEGSLLY
jgi:hypothetical protein